MGSSMRAALHVAAVLQCVMLAVGQGTWQTIQKTAGISSMHTAITHFDTAIMLDRTNIGPSQIRLPGGRCRNQPLERISKRDCYAHSVMMNTATGAVRPLYIFTDTWCSSGQFVDNGKMVQTGGDFEGSRKIRTLQPCSAREKCDWEELPDRENLNVGRWYASNQLLPTGTRQIVVGGRVQPSYEFYPKRRAGEGVFKLSILDGPDNMYPFVYLLPSNDLFVFSNRASVQLNWNSGRVVRRYPNIPGNPRNYPSAGSAVMLPLNWNQNFGVAEIMVCGGAAEGATRKRDRRAPASASCGRIVATAGRPRWSMFDMPIRRTMGDMLNLPTGEVLVINGAMNGYQGWETASNPVLNPLSYNPGNGRFTSLTKATIPRMYHCTANLLSDGRILVAGSNTHQYYTYTGPFPTELRVEAFSPPYMKSGNRPVITSNPRSIVYKQQFALTFTVGTRRGAVDVTMINAPFVTHSFAQGQRQMKLRTSAPRAAGRGYSVTVTAVSGNTIAPPSWYMLFLLQNGVPSKGVWVKQNN